MPVTCTLEERQLTACIEGELDHPGAKKIMEELGRQIDVLLPRELILDLEKVTFSDSSAIAVVLRSWKRMVQLGGGMQVIHTPEQTAKVFRAAGLDRMIQFKE
ncbi:MAG: anti-sigma factor antagonist [Lawsonibacter sp.]|jgi:stage II sporulation protein AA (anti-sigma F factor antagonist)